MVDVQRDFERLREEDALLAPGFESMIGAAGSRVIPGTGGLDSRRTRVPRLAAGLAAAAVIVIAGVFLVRRTDPGLVGTELATALTTGSEVGWTSPTDFLLELPGSDLLRAVPELGAPPTPGATRPQPASAGVDSARKGHDES